MAQLNLTSLTSWIAVAAVEHPRNLTSVVVRRLGVTRAAAVERLKQLVELNWLVREGRATRPMFRPGLLRQVVRSYTLADLAENQVWTRDFAPFTTLPHAVQRMAQHVFCELLNNAIEHSEGSSATVSLRQTPSHVQLLVSDNGRGLFDKVQHFFGFADPRQAMLELSKGKLTSSPERHGGRGLYISSKLTDVLDLHANLAAFQHREWTSGQWLPCRPLKHQGTSAYAAIALDTARSLESVLSAHDLDSTGYTSGQAVSPLNSEPPPQQRVAAGDAAIARRKSAATVSSR